MYGGNDSSMYILTGDMIVLIPPMVKSSPLLTDLFPPRGHSTHDGPAPTTPYVANNIPKPDPVVSI